MYLMRYCVVFLMLLCGLSSRAAAPGYSPVAPLPAGASLRFPADYGAHPDYKIEWWYVTGWLNTTCLLYTSPSPRDLSTSRMPSSA